MGGKREKEQERDKEEEQARLYQSKGKGDRRGRKQGGEEKQGETLIQEWKEKQDCHCFVEGVERKVETACSAFPSMKKR
ncbi:hypothetical protein AGOR_G00007740 [Albula goreensis]|uniref:Uncharacterized protein n=1 Tax=Albula goreensis TaxID=1534307 RepID=A0A8T3E9Q0_9TELE|nr:hypothetical protein AGOR_G00007740 [Albula goreensis]